METNKGRLNLQESFRDEIEVLEVTFSGGLLGFGGLV